jgi:hypothetical protein
MSYLFATEHPDYSDLASGRVFYSLSGHPAFPIRLASETFQRCQAIRTRNGQTGRVVLYDPCCGAGYLISVLGYLHMPQIRAAIGSDINVEAVTLAGRNLGLLQPAGLSRRMAEIEDMIRRYGKESHRAALHSCAILQERICRMQAEYPLATSAFQADTFDGSALVEHLAGVQADIVLTDVPYGLHSEWQAENRVDAPKAMLDALRGVLAPGGLVAVASDKHQKITGGRFRRVEHFQVGKRKVTIMKLDES